MNARGSVAFVTGEAGTGKTALTQEFVRRAVDAHDELVVAIGSSSAHTGIGDAYAPWRQVLAQLSGDLETRVAGGMGRERTRRLCEVAPAVAEAMPLAGRKVLVVDDGSSDGTADVARAAGVEVLVHEVNKGKGGALATGNRWAVEQGYGRAVTVVVNSHRAALSRERTTTHAWRWSPSALLPNAGTLRSGRLQRGSGDNIPTSVWRLRLVLHCSYGSRFLAGFEKVLKGD